MKPSLVKILNTTCQDKFSSLLNAVNTDEAKVRDAAASRRYLSAMDAPTFSQEQLDALEWCGYEDFEDAEMLRGLSLLPDLQTHYALYGKTQGRQILEKIEKTNIKHVAFVAPSYGKQCGIGEYGRYLETSFKAIGKKAYSFRTSSELLAQSDQFVRNTLVLVNHGPGLFDGFNPKLGQGESTKQLLQNLIQLRERGALPVILMHSLIDSDQELLYSRQQMILNSEIPTVTFISDASRHFYIPQVELGVSPVQKPKEVINKKDDRSERQEIVGFFGFFQYGGKDFDALFHLVRSIRGKLAGSVATSNADELKRFTDLLDSTDIPHDLGSGWVTDKELAQRLSKADYFYLPQNDYDYWNNSATARFVMNLERPVFLPPHQPFLDIEEGAVFANKDDLPRIVSYYREEKNYQEAVKISSEFRKKADMRNTASKLSASVYSTFKEKSLQTVIASNDTSLQRFLGLDEQRKTLFLSTVGYHEEFRIENASQLVDDGYFSSVYKSVPATEYWRKHFNLEDLVQNTLLESVHVAYSSFCKRPVKLAELVSVSRYKVEQTDSTSGELLSHAIKSALGFSDKTTRFNKPTLAIYNANLPANEEHISPDHLNDLIAENLNNLKTIEENEAASPRNRPFINNVIEMITQPEHVLDDRDFSIDIKKIDMTEVLSHNSLYLRYNSFINQCSQNGINVADSAIVDQPVVRLVEHNRLTYELEDIYFYSDDLFIAQAVRCLFKRDAFPLEMIALREMLSTLGKIDVLRYLNENGCRRARIRDLDDTRLRFLEPDFEQFAEVMRDPVSGSVQQRNRYLVEKRDVYRWWLKSQSTEKSYLSDSADNVRSLLSLYFHLCSADNTINHRSGEFSQEGDVAHWLTVDGTFINSESVISSVLRLVPDQPLSICNVGVDNKPSFVNFQKIEPEGSWTKDRSAYLLFAIDSGAMRKEDFDYSVSVTLRSYGSKKVPGRHVRVSAVADVAEAEASVVDGMLVDDAAKLFSLPLKNAAESNYFVFEFYISATTNPQVLDESPDDRELGLMVQQMVLHRQQKPVIEETESQQEDVSAEVAEEYPGGEDFDAGTESAA